MKILKLKSIKTMILPVIIFLALQNITVNANSDSLKYIMHSFVKIKTSEGKVIL